jgi:hypothetical protein
MKSRKKGLAAAAATLGCALLAPAAAHAAVAVSVTGDDTNPVALGAGAAPITIRNMDASAAVHVDDASDAHSFSYTIAGPGGPAASNSECWISKYGPDDKKSVDYHGNGAYTLTLSTFSDTECSKDAKASTYSWTVAAGVAVSPPAPVMLTRQANSFSTVTQLFNFTGNPGALGYDIKYELNGQVNPADGSLGGVPKDAFVDPTTGKVSLLESTPGTYTLVARAKAFSGTTTAWTPPVTFTLVAPFDFSTLSFPDQIGPSYQLRGYLGYDAASGKVTIAYAAGKKGKHFHSLGSAKIDGKGRITRRFTIRKTGYYRLRFSYKGSGTMIKGTIYDVIRIRSHRL